MKQSDTFKLIIPEEVEKKIRHICQKIWKDEWSGTLFYKPEGSFEDGSLTIRCVDIFVMDIGTAAYTEFDMSPDVISYMTENPDLLDCQMGLIHSHNNMSTFFSGTDTATLKEEGVDRNHFVSLIVNNEGTYTAAITRKLKSTKVIEEQFSYPTFEDNEVVDTKSYEVENEELQWFYLKIIFERAEESFRGEIDARLEEIRKAKAEKAKAAQKPVYNGYGNWQGSKSQQGTTFPVPSQGVKPAQSTTQIGKKVTQSFVGQAGPANIIKKEPELPFEVEEEPIVIPYGEVKFNEKTIKSLVLQLITGSIIIADSSKIDVNKWAKGMSTLYKRRFGEGEYGFKAFKAWAEGYIDYICWYTEDDALIEQGATDDEIAAICAHDIVEELTKLPENEYIKAYIDILEGYII